MKGIILAGGSGTRLYPITKGISKQLVPVYDKPMIYYPLSLLMIAGITEILIISTKWHLKKFRDLLGDGETLNIKLEYKIQENPDGIAQAFLIAEDFIGTSDVCLVLGDNILYGQGLTSILRQVKEDVSQSQKAFVFGYYVNDPWRYGVAEFDEEGKVLTIEEKPENPKSNHALIGLYFYPNNVVNIAKNIKPSERGELEITSVNEEYLRHDMLEVYPLGRGYAWFDTGTQDSLLDASNFIATVEKRQGLKISCLEEIAYRMNYISKKQLLKLAEEMKKSSYGKYLMQILERKVVVNKREKVQ
ncbi:MAG TPA: glucose-1-phosphate thymidylyltransferase [Arcobacter sp.]|nr:glucose-1-phosphate thymidylyltransferase [Arcobacter sp.]